MPLRRRGRLRVAVPAPLGELRPGSGHGQVWHAVLDGLRREASLRFAEVVSADDSVVPRDPSAGDVWLADGHAGALRVPGPVVVQVHEIGWADAGLRDLLDPGFAAAIERSTAAGVGAADGVIVPSESARGQVIDACGVPAERVTAVPHGVDARRFRPGLRGGRERVAAAAGGAGAPYVLFAAVIHPRKNLAAVREAVAGLARRGFPHLLAVAGGPAPDRGDSSELEAAARAEVPGAPGRVVRVAAPDSGSLAALMAGADAFCLPSLSEGFGLTALEAMACGTPVVVSDRGALPEVVGDAGVVVPPEAAAVEEALAALLGDSDRARRLGRAGRARAEGFTWRRTVEGWLAVLRRVAG